MERTVLGLDLGGSSVKWGVVAPDGQQLDHGREEIRDRHPEAVAQVLGAIVRDVRGRQGDRLAAVGVGSPGLIDATRRIVRTSPNFSSWDDVPLAERLEEAAGGLPVVLENDANVLVYSETRWGAAVGKNHVVVLTLGTGVGGGAMVDGALLRGKGGGAGELGHITLDPEGPRCGCGNHGCFEVFCNIEGTLRAAREIYAPDSAPDEPAALAEAARSGDERARRTWARVGRWLGIGVASLVNVFNPEAVLIGGGLSGAGEWLLDPARDEAARRAFDHNWADLVFRRAGLGEEAGLLGAAAMAFEAAGVETRAPDGA